MHTIWNVRLFYFLKDHIVYAYCMLTQSSFTQLFSLLLFRIQLHFVTGHSTVWCDNHFIDHFQADWNNPNIYYFCDMLAYIDDILLFADVLTTEKIITVWCETHTLSCLSSINSNINERFSDVILKFSIIQRDLNLNGQNASLQWTHSDELSKWYRMINARYMRPVFGMK